MSGAASLFENSENESEGKKVWAGNQIELAECLGVSRETIGRWAKQAGCPGHKADGRYNVEDWQTWMQTSGKTPKKRLPKDKHSLEIERLELDNEKRRTEQDLFRGKLNDQDEVIQVMTALFGSLVNKLRTVKHNLAPSVVGETVPEATKRIGIQLDEALQELSLGEWAKKKVFWQSVSRRLCDLLAENRLSTGPAPTSS